MLPKDGGDQNFFAGNVLPEICFLGWKSNFFGMLMLGHFWGSTKTGKMISMNGACFMPFGHVFGCWLLLCLEPVSGRGQWCLHGISESGIWVLSYDFQFVSVFKFVCNFSWYTQKIASSLQVQILFQETSFEVIHVKTKISRVSEFGACPTFRRRCGSHQLNQRILRICQPENLPRLNCFLLWENLAFQEHPKLLYSRHHLCFFWGGQCVLALAFDSYLTFDSSAWRLVFRLLHRFFNFFRDTIVLWIISPDSKW